MKKHQPDHCPRHAHPGFVPCCLLMNSQIWVITDQPALGERISKLLGDCGALVDVIHSSIIDQKPLSCVQYESPVVFVVDVTGQAEHGLNIMSRLQHRFNHPAIVALTPSFTPEFASKVLSQGVSYYLSYDFLENEFREVIRTLLNSQAHRPGFSGAH